MNEWTIQRAARQIANSHVEYGEGGKEQDARDALVAILDEIEAYLDDHADIIDYPDGRPGALPNTAMRLLTELQEVRKDQRL